jgi:hypothetical protein
MSFDPLLWLKLIGPVGMKGHYLTLPAASVRVFLALSAAQPQPSSSSFSPPPQVRPSVRQ